MVFYLMKKLNETENKIYKRNYIATLNWMSYFYELGKVEEANAKKNK